MNSITELIKNKLMDTLEEGEYCGGVTNDNEGNEISIGHSSFMKINNQILKVPSGMIISDFHNLHK